MKSVLFMSENQGPFSATWFMNPQFLRLDHSTSLITFRQRSDIAAGVHRGYPCFLGLGIVSESPSSIPDSPYSLSIRMVRESYDRMFALLGEVLSSQFLHADVEEGCVRFVAGRTSGESNRSGFEFSLICAPALARALWEVAQFGDDLDGFRRYPLFSADKRTFFPWGLACTCVYP